MTRSRKPSVCFVAQFAHGALCGGRTGFVGGIEWQQSLMARWFAQRGYPVSVVTWDEGQPDGVVVDGVRVFKLCRADAGVPGLRFFHPRWSSLVGALRRADADLYYQNCGEYVTGQIAAWCRWRKRRFVYSTASDPDCDPRLPTMRTWRERVLYRYGLRHADRVITQTERQCRMLSAGFGIESTVIPMPCPGLLDGEFVRPRPPCPGSARVAWIARLARVKRPDRLLDVAQRMPDVKFDIVGPASDGAYSQEVLARAARMPNVAVHGRATRDEMPDWYKRIDVLCCTSDYEGLPNTFLEAWSHGVPVVSTFDPGDLIQTHALGCTAGDVPGVTAGLRALLDSPVQWQRVSENARRYYLDNHTVEAVMPRFEDVFRQALERPVGSGGRR